MPDLHVPYSVGDDTDTEQNKARRGQWVTKPSIENYRHATTKFGKALENFTPLWFSIPLSFGGMSIVLLTPFPYQARWISICGTIFFVCQLVLFILFAILTIARVALYPQVVLRRALSNVDELATWAIPPITFLTIASLVASVVSQAYWGGYAFTLVAYVMWWIGLAAIFSIFITIYVVLIDTGLQNDRKMSSTILLAPIGLATSAVEAAFIVDTSYGISAKLAEPMIIVGYFTIGMATFVAIILFTIWLHHLLTVGFPPGPKIPSMCLTMGPCGQIATGFILLGRVASSKGVFASYDKGPLLTSNMAMNFYGTGVLIAMCLMGFAIFWMALVIFIFIRDALIKRKSTYSLVWWSIIFPTSTIITAFIELATEMDSPAFRVISAGLYVLILIGFFANIFFTIKHLFTGKLLMGPPTQLETEMSQQKKADEEQQNGKME